MGNPVNKRLLTTLIPLNALRPESLNELASKAKTEKLRSGQFLFKAGDNDKQHIYLLSGKVELLSDHDVVSSVKGGTDASKHAIGHTQPRTLSARAKSDVHYLRIDSDLLDIMLTWDQTGSYQVEELQADNPTWVNTTSADWMTQILQTRAFHRIPPANIQAMFMRMELISYNSGDVIIRQGEIGDYFYTITDGHCLVTRATPSQPRGVKLAELGPGDSFGEEALISSAKRNATITMLTAGTMMRLSKTDFMSLLNEPLLNWVNYPDGQAMVQHERSVWIDVRLPSEYQHGHIKGSINIPLIFLRIKIKNLDKTRKYILCCDTERRSSAASFILNEHGFDVYLLQGGIPSVPGANVVTGKPPVAKTSPS